MFRGRVSEDEFWDDFVAKIVFRFPEVCQEGGAEALDNEWFKRLFYQTTQKTMPGPLDVFKRIMYYPMHVGHGGRGGDGMPDVILVADSANESILELHNYHPEVFETAAAEVWSSRFHQVKTDPFFFSFMLKGFHGEPDEYLFISRDQEAIDLAEKSGIPCIKFIDAEQTENEMSRLGFMFYPKEEL